MDKDSVLKTISELRKASKQRKFKQTVDLIFSFQGLDLKKPEQQLDFYTQLPRPTGSNIKICALVGPELKEEAGKVCDTVVLQSDFASYDAKKAKLLAREHTYFIAQANIMGAVATAFGKVFGPRGKMPNPKAGCVVPPRGALGPLCQKLRQTKRIAVKTQQIYQTSIGKEDTSDDDLAENALAIYSQLMSHLPSMEHNIKATYLKFTMTKPIKVL